MSHYDVLTKRERCVLRLAAGGYSVAEIAAHLVLSPQTVKWYLKQIYSKLCVHSRVQATLRACELGLITLAGLAEPSGDRPVPSPARLSIPPS